MKTYNKIEDFLQLMEDYDLIYVEVGHDVYIELKSLHWALTGSIYFIKGKSTIKIYRNEYEKEAFDEIEEIIFQQKLQECDSTNTYFSAEDFENEIYKRDTFIETDNGVWINLYHYGTYKLKEIFHYARPKNLIFKYQYSQEALDAYFLMKKMIK